MVLTKATLEVLEHDRAFEVQFNPNTLELSKETVVAEIGVPGLGAPLLQYVRGGAETLDVELFCDTTRDGMDEHARDVREFTQPIRRLADVDPERGAIPVVRFSWGQGLAFTGLVVRIEQTFTLFSPAGVPLRARLALRLKEFKTLEEQLASARASRGARAGGTRGAAARSARAGPEAGGEGNAPATVLGGLEILLDGKPLAARVCEDVLSLVVADSLDGIETFELTLNNWDERRAALKHSEESLLDPGRELEFRFHAARGRPAATRRKPRAKKAGSRPAPMPGHTLVTGRIESVRQPGLGTETPVVVVRGAASVPPQSRAARARVSTGRGRTIRLVHGETLLGLDSELTLADTPPASAKARGRARGEVRIAAVGTAAGVPELRAGVRVEIEGVGARFNGRWLVTAARHSFSDAGYLTHFDGRKEDA